VTPHARFLRLKNRGVTDFIGKLTINIDKILYIFMYTYKYGSVLLLQPNAFLIGLNEFFSTKAKHIIFLSLKFALHKRSRSYRAALQYFSIPESEPPDLDAVGQYHKK
jgi:isocitrate dehydrogenase kinase/phosphatase